MPSRFSFLIAPLLLLFCLLLSDFAAAQNTRFTKRYNTPWPHRNQKAVGDDSLSQAYAKESVVILFEKEEWEVNNIQNSTLVHKQMRLLYQDKEGIAAHGEITVPSSKDPAYEYMDVPLHKRDELHRPKYFNLTIEYFLARIIRDGKTYPTKVVHSIQTEKQVYNANQIKAFSYSFSFPDLQAGDILEISYKYFLPFQFDRQRFFFHGDLPKQHSEFHYTFPASEYYIWNYGNGGQFTDSTYTDIRARSTVTYSWVNKQLAPCINEVGSRPHTDLPFAEYYAHNKVYGTYANDRLQEFKPYVWNYVAFDRIRFKNRVKRIGRRLSAREIALNMFYGRYDSIDSPLRKLEAMHNTIANGYRYKTEKDHFANTDPRLGKLENIEREVLLRSYNDYRYYQGVFDRLISDSQHNIESFIGNTASRMENINNCIEKELLRPSSRFSLYRGLLDRLDKPYTWVDLADARIGSLHPDVCMPTYGLEELYAVNVDGHLFYLLPKKARTGYQLNELPFYYEDVPSMHIDQLSENYDHPTNVTFYNTPNSSLEDNSRKSSVKVAVNTQENEMDFNAAIELNGQFSTLCRGRYQYEEIADSTINPRYHYRIFDRGELNYDQKTVLQKTTSDKVDMSVDKQYPFTAKIKTDYRIDDQIKSKGKKGEEANKNTYVISLTEWFKHIIHPSFTAENRQTTYHVDFPHRDTYNYLLTFDQPIQIADFKDLPLVLKNETGSYLFDITQNDAQSVLIRSDFQLQVDQVKPENADQLEALFQAIKKVEKATLRFNIAE